jgi:hypothetical protein
MSFRCQDCEGAFPNKEHPTVYSPERLVTQTRPRDSGIGTDIVEERNLCRTCAGKRRLGSA